MKSEKKNVVAINKEMVKVVDGKVMIESDELANAIQNENIELFIDEEANLVSGDQGICGVNCDDVRQY